MIDVPLSLLSSSFTPPLPVGCRAVEGMTCDMPYAFAPRLLDALMKAQQLISFVSGAVLAPGLSIEFQF